MASLEEQCFEDFLLEMEAMHLQMLQRVRAGLGKETGMDSHDAGSNDTEAAGSNDAEAAGSNDTEAAGSNDAVSQDKRKLRNKKLEVLMTAYKPADSPSQEFANLQVRRAVKLLGAEAFLK